MSKSTTIINNLNTDRVVQITISKRKYLLFTFMHRVLIVIDMTNKKKPILLMNRTYYTQNDLIKWADKIIAIASVSNSNEEFMTNMDTYIDLRSTIKNETTEELLAMYKILLEDYNL